MTSELIISYKESWKIGLGGWSKIRIVHNGCEKNYQILTGIFDDYVINCPIGNISVSDISKRVNGKYYLKKIFGIFGVKSDLDCVLLFCQYYKPLGRENWISSDFAKNDGGINRDDYSPLFDVCFNNKIEEKILIIYDYLFDGDSDAKEDFLKKRKNIKDYVDDKKIKLFVVKRKKGDEILSISDVKNINKNISKDSIMKFLTRNALKINRQIIRHVDKKNRSGKINQIEIYNKGKARVFYRFENGDDYSYEISDIKKKNQEKFYYKDLLFPEKNSSKTDSKKNEETEYVIPDLEWDSSVNIIEIYTRIFLREENAKVLIFKIGPIKSPSPK